MKNNALILAMILSASLIVGFVIVSYYWGIRKYVEILHPPFWVWLVALIYILLQIVRRKISHDRRWWDWLYYVGLSAMVLPVFFGNEEIGVFFIRMAQWGSFMFLVPVLLYGSLMVKRK